MKDNHLANDLLLELARHLEDLAQRLRQGERAEDIKLSPGVEAYVHLKEKKGRHAAKVSLKWVAPAYSSPDQVPCKDEGLKQLGSFKEIKKRLAAVLKELQKTAGQGNFPEEERLQELDTLSREFHRFAEPEWQAEMEIYLEHVANLELAWKSKQLEMFQHELRDLQNQMVACHREHK